MQSDERPPHDGLFAYLGLACAITWVFAAPAALAFMRHSAPPPFAVACAGLSAFGPLLAAVAVAARTKRLGEVFRRWRTNPAWIVLALLTPMAAHLVATALFALAGGHPTAWLHPPNAPERWAALVVFPIGEEFGWRGFAHPRMMGRYGFVKGSLVLGAFWGLWHLAYAITPDAGRFDLLTFATLMIELPLYTLIITWVFEHANRSMAVALAFHAGGHLDRLENDPHADFRIHVLHVVIVAIVAVIAARQLRQRRRELGASSV